MLNDDWGWQYDSNFFTRNVVEVTGLGPNNEYIYDEFGPSSISSRDSFRSLWELRMGLEINFR